MKIEFKNQMRSLVSIAMIMSILVSCSEDDKNAEGEIKTTKTKTAIATFGNTTQIPEGITTPDVVETSIGTLNFFDGVPTKETADNVQDYLDRARGVDVFLKGIPGNSLQELRRGPASLGVNANGKVAIFDNLMDSKALFLTANTSTLYIMPYINTKEEGPIVVEVPPGMLGALTMHGFGMWVT